MTSLTLNELPYVTAKSARILGKMRVALDDFIVDEIPAYLPCGQGSHLFVRFEKSDLTTPAAVRTLARVLGVPESRSSYAGLKDRRGITRQWASFEHADPQKLSHLEDDKLRVLEFAAHGNKLKTGHLAGNRFEIRVRDVEGSEETARDLLSQLQSRGCPNYYGEQRFGRDGDNAEAALAFVRNTEKPPRDRFRRRFLFSAFQSALFNRWLADRVKRGELHQAVPGDLMRKEDSGGLFTSDDLAVLEARMASFAISATGPMFGVDMRPPTGEASTREQALLAEFAIDEDMLRAHRKLGQGTRRVSRIRPEAVSVQQDGPGCLRFAFTLPRGAYATTLMREVMKSDGNDSDGAQPDDD